MLLFHTVSRGARHFAFAAVLVLISVVVLLFSIFGSVRSQQFDGLQVRGTASFNKQVVSALGLLRQKAPAAYRIITNHVGAIKQARRSGMRNDLVPPTFELANPTALYSVTWCAGSIAH